MSRVKVVCGAILVFLAPSLPAATEASFWRPVSEARVQSVVAEARQQLDALASDAANYRQLPAAPASCRRTQSDIPASWTTYLGHDEHAAENARREIMVMLPPGMSMDEIKKLAPQRPPEKKIILVSPCDAGSPSRLQVWSQGVSGGGLSKLDIDSVHLLEGLPGTVPSVLPDRVVSHVSSRYGHLSPRMRSMTLMLIRESGRLQVMVTRSIESPPQFPEHVMIRHVVERGRHRLVTEVLDIMKDPRPSHRVYENGLLVASQRDLDLMRFNSEGEMTRERLTLSGQGSAVTEALCQVRMDGQGPYKSPFTQDGVVAAWTEKAISVRLGSQVGAVTGALVTGQALKDIPVAGQIVGGIVGNKVGTGVGRQLALRLIGGDAVMAASSDVSADDPGQLACWVVMNHGEHDKLDEVMEALQFIYPDVVSAIHDQRRARRDAQQAQRLRDDREHRRRALSASGAQATPAVFMPYRTLTPTK